MFQHVAICALLFAPLVIGCDTPNTNVVIDNSLAVVSDQAFADFGGSITYDRWRFYLNVASPLVIRGQSGMASGYSFGSLSLDLGSNPDAVSDLRIGTDVRVFGRSGGHLRLGVGAQLFVPSGNRADYDTDGTFRGMLRALVAGDAPYFTYAAHLGVHVRPKAAS